MLKTSLVAALAVTLVATATARPEANAFINRPANTVPELIAQMKSDPVVMDRFMRHFSMTRSEVLAYVGSLRLGVIPKGGAYSVYSVPEGGRIRVHTSYFKAGTPAFVDANGRPILRIKCGNPFVRGPKYVASLGTPGPADVEDMNLRPIEDTMAIATPPEPSDTFAPQEYTELTPGVEPPTSELPVTPAFPTTDPQPINLAPLAALAGLGAAFSFGGSGGDSTPTPVPEPATLLALGAGAAAIAARRKKRQD